MNHDHYDRVTSILSAFVSYDEIDPAILERKKQIGTAVHLAAEKTVDAGLGIIEDDPVIAGYLRSYEKWSKGRIFIATEQTFVCDELQLKGQPDRIEKCDDENDLYDIKTSKRMRRQYELQLSAYAYLARKNGIRIRRVGIVLLDEFGDYPYVIYPNENWPIFLSCLQVHRFFRMELKNGDTKSP